MKKKIIIISIAIAAVSAGCYFKYTGNKNATYYWRNVPVEKGDLSVLVTATGSIAPDTSVDIGVQVSGVIAKINADFNDNVKRGQVIAVLDTALYYAAKLDAAATLQRAQIAVDESKREYDREKNLLDNKVAAQSDYDQALTAWQTAQGNLISAQAQLNRAVINLQYCTIKAPISGNIVARNVQIGNMVIASFNSPVLFTIANNLKKMQMQADVDEADIGQVQTGQQTKFTVDAYPNDVFTGVVTQIRHQPVMIQNVVNYVVIIEVPNPDLKLMPGLTANANIFIQQRNNVLKIPSNAFAFTPPVEYIKEDKLLNDSTRIAWMRRLRQAGEIKKRQIVESNATSGYVWINRGKDIFPVEVRKGLSDGTFTEVSADLKEGDEAATGVNHSPAEAEAQTTQNPFMPKFPTAKKK